MQFLNYINCQAYGVAVAANKPRTCNDAFKRSFRPLGSWHVYVTLWYASRISYPSKRLSSVPTRHRSPLFWDTGQGKFICHEKVTLQAFRGQQVNVSGTSVAFAYKISCSQEGKHRSSNSWADPSAINAARASFFAFCRLYRYVPVKFQVICVRED